MAGNDDHAHGHHDAHAGHQAADGAVKDPVCGMMVDPHTAKYRHAHGGRTYYFCSGKCREKFAATPEKYLAPAAATKNGVPPGTIYTCPMHPQIRQTGPGSCPICGMALEPVNIAAGVDGEDDSELRDMTLRFRVGAVLTLPLIVLAMGHVIPAIGMESWVNGLI